MYLRNCIVPSNSTLDLEARTLGIKASCIVPFRDLFRPGTRYVQLIIRYNRKGRVRVEYPWYSPSSGFYDTENGVSMMQFEINYTSLLL
jgi:hypothetical protein